MGLTGKDSRCGREAPEAGARREPVSWGGAPGSRAPCRRLLEFWLLLPVKRRVHRAYEQKADT